MPPRDPTDLIGRESDDAVQAASTQRRREKELEDFRWLMARPQGRRFVNRVLGFCGVNRTSMHNSGSWVAFNEGRRDVGLYLMLDINDHFLDDYVQMLKEARIDDRIDD